VSIDKKTLRNVFLGIVGCILLIWVLYDWEKVGAYIGVLAGVMSPFVLGAGLAFIINVPMRAFENVLIDVRNQGLRRVFAVMLTLLTFMLVIMVVFWLLIPQLVATFQSLIPKVYNFVMAVEVRLDEFLSENPELMKWIAANTDLESLDWATLAQNAVSMVGNSVSALLGGAFSAIGSVTSGTINLVLAVIFAIYCLFGKESLARQGRKLLYAFFPEAFSDETIRILRLTNSTFSNFLSGQCIEVIILGIMFAISMTVFNMPYVTLVSVLVAVTAFIPLVGAFVGCILGAFFILVDNPLQAVWFVVMFLVLQQIECNLIYPRVVGGSIGLPGMWVLVAVALGGELMGISGMFLMIPMASVVYTLLREYTYKRLAQRQIDPQKLRDQPLQLPSRFEEQRQRSRRKRSEKQALRDKLKWEMKKKTKE